MVLPEMAATGYLFPDPEAAREVAEPADGPTLSALAPIARARRAWIVAGFPERAGDALYNSALMIDSRGSLAGVYRKTLLYAPDTRWCSPGDSGYRAFDIAGRTVGVGICMDLNDDRFITWVTRAGVEIVAFPTNWVHEDQVDVHRYWRWRLTGTASTLVAANRWGREDDTTFCGRSAILDARRVWAAAPRRGDGVLLATIAPG